jgi:hypothetical protein
MLNRGLLLTISDIFIYKYFCDFTLLFHIKEFQKLRAPNKSKIMKKSNKILIWEASFLLLMIQISDCPKYNILATKILKRI